jgi:hypothetical protein
MKSSKGWRALVTDTQLLSWKHKGFTVERLAAMTGLTTSAISRRLQDVYTRSPADPDEATIAQRCDEIQRDWSDADRQKRWVGRGGRWSATGVPGSVIRSALRSQTGYAEQHEYTLTCARS